jgi:hypothetical protein
MRKEDQDEEEDTDEDAKWVKISEKIVSFTIQMTV